MDLVSEFQRCSAVHHVENLLLGEGIVVDADIVESSGIISAADQAEFDSVGRDAGAGRDDDMIPNTCRNRTSQDAVDVYGRRGETGGGNRTGTG